MLTEESRVDQVTAQWIGPSEDVPGRWVVNVRRADRVLKDGTVIASTGHRHVLELDDKLTDQDPLVVAVVRAVKRESVKG